MSNILSNDVGLIRLLLVEDDEKLARLTTRYLESHGVVVVWTANGAEGLQAALQTPFDLVLLDVMLPGLSGVEVCRELRQHSDVPIIIVTARGNEADRVTGLETGADDYLLKPFSSPELLARIRAHVRRARGKAGPSLRSISVGDLVIDPGSLTASKKGKPLSLTSDEFALLRALAERAGHVLSREQLLDLTGSGAEESFDRSIDVRISRLRAKLGDDSRKPRLLKTVRGVGYLLSNDS